jgi:hypothetical protein
VRILRDQAFTDFMIELNRNNLGNDRPPAIRRQLEAFMAEVEECQPSRPNVFNTGSHYGGNVSERNAAGRLNSCAVDRWESFGLVITEP